MANLPPRFRATVGERLEKFNSPRQLRAHAPGFEFPSSTPHFPHRLRATAPSFDPPSNPATSRPRSATQVSEPEDYVDDLPTPRPPLIAPACQSGHPEPPEYLRLTSLCCQSVAPDPEDERHDETYEAFLARCENNIESYPTLEALREHIQTKPQTASRMQDWFPNIDEAIRHLAGWEADGRPDYYGALRALQNVTVQGRRTKQRFPGSVLTSPSRALCGRANALSAYVHYMFACGKEEIDVRSFDGSDPGPPFAEWQVFLCAVAHAADAARQKMISPIVLSVGYAFRELANQVGCHIGNSEFFTPLLLALRQHQGCEISQRNNIPSILRVDENTCGQLRNWIVDMNIRFKDRPDPYWDGKIPIPLRYTPWSGVLND